MIEGEYTGNVIAYQKRARIPSLVLCISLCRRTPPFISVQSETRSESVNLIMTVDTSVPPSANRTKAVHRRSILSSLINIKWNSTNIFACRDLPKAFFSPPLGVASAIPRGSNCCFQRQFLVPGAPRDSPRQSLPVYPGNSSVLSREIPSRGGPRLSLNEVLSRINRPCPPATSRSLRFIGKIGRR